MLVLKKAILRSFDAGDYTATVEIGERGKVYLEDIPVARSVPAVELVAGRRLVVVFFDEHNAKDAVVVAVY